MEISVPADFFSRQTPKSLQSFQAIAGCINESQLNQEILNLTTGELTERIKQQALRAGFDNSAVCPAIRLDAYPRFQEWLQRGYAGKMHYLEARAEAYANPQQVMEGVRSLLVLTTNYRTVEPQPPQPGQGRVSRYAWGNRDYHDVIHERLKALCRWITTHYPHSRNRGVVDTAPLLERQFAQLAGLGWQGKNTLLLNQQTGSLFFLAVVLTDLELVYDLPHAADHCGTCRACLDACPTDAFPEPYVLDARKCISYLTIELREPIPSELRDKMANWLFGCDVCQDVCPWNHRAPLSDLLEFYPAPDNNPVDLCALFRLDDAAFRRRFRQSPLWRSKRQGILRNAAILLGTQRLEASTSALVSGLNDVEPLVRGASAWALGRLTNQAAHEALCRRHVVEANDGVAGEIRDALANWQGTP